MGSKFQLAFDRTDISPTCKESLTDLPDLDSLSTPNFKRYGYVRFALGDRPSDKTIPYIFGEPTEEEKKEIIPQIARVLECEAREAKLQDYDMTRATNMAREYVQEAVAPLDTKKGGSSFVVDGNIRAIYLREIGSRDFNNMTEILLAFHEGRHGSSDQGYASRELSKTENRHFKETDANIYAALAMMCIAFGHGQETEQEFTVVPQLVHEARKELREYSKTALSDEDRDKVYDYGIKQGIDNVLALSDEEIASLAELPPEQFEKFTSKFSRWIITQIANQEGATTAFPSFREGYGRFAVSERPALLSAENQK